MEDRLISNTKKNAKRARHTISVAAEFLLFIGIIALAMQTGKPGIGYKPLTADLRMLALSSSSFHGYDDIEETRDILNQRMETKCQKEGKLRLEHT